MHDHGGALDYDLMTKTRYTIDDVGERLSVRSLSHFLLNLPPDSATMRAIHPEDAERLAWSEGHANAQILAVLVDEVRELKWMYQSYSERRRHARPKPFPTPWDASSDESKRIGKGAVSVADFETWWDSKD